MIHPVRDSRRAADNRHNFILPYSEVDTSKRVQTYPLMGHGQTIVSILVAHRRWESPIRRFPPQQPDLRRLLPQQHRNQDSHPP